MLPMKLQMKIKRFGSKEIQRINNDGIKSYISQKKRCKNERSNEIQRKNCNFLGNINKSFGNIDKYKL